MRVGSVLIRPTGSLTTVGPASFVDDDFAVYSAPDGKVDAVIGPTLNGLRVHARLNATDDATKLAWSVTGDHGAELREGDDGAVSVYSDGGGVVARIAAEARDATGADVPAVLQADPTGALTVMLGQLPAPSTFPVLVSLSLGQSTTSTGGGWHVHAFGHQLEGSQFELRRGSLTTGTCRFNDLRVNASPGKPQERRAVAIDWMTCRAIEEVGEPSPSEVTEFFSAEDASSDSDPQLRSRASATRFRARSRSAAGTQAKAKPESRIRAHAAADPRWYYRYKAIWEDPAGLDTTWIAPKVNWAYYGGCVHNPVYYGVDWGMVSETGWQLISRTPYSSATCGGAVRQENAKFEGGQYFPLCLGQKVQAYYWPASAYGFPSGVGAGAASTWLTGHSCKSLLHYDSVVSQGPG